MKDILHLRNKKVTLALEQIRYEEWLHGQGKRRRRVLERLRKETALLDKKAAKRIDSIQKSMVSPSQGLTLGLDKGPVGKVGEAPSQEPVVEPSPKSPFKDPVEIQLEGIKVLYDCKIFYGKFDKYVVKPGNKNRMMVLPQVDLNLHREHSHPHHRNLLATIRVLVNALMLTRA